jgi:hypothetical protein
MATAVRELPSRKMLYSLLFALLVHSVRLTFDAAFGVVDVLKRVSE